MKFPISFLAIFLLVSCWQTSKDPTTSSDNSNELYNTFDRENHLLPDFDKVRFDTLHEWDLGWALLETINNARGEGEEIKLSKKLSPGQKALYFYWYLNNEVTNGGFIQFYWNNYRKYIPPIEDGLKLIGDSAMLTIIELADKEYLNNKDRFDLQRPKNDWSPLYDSLQKFEIYDSMFYAIQNKPMELIEVYVRKHPKEFVNLK